MKKLITVILTLLVASTFAFTQGVNEQKSTDKEKVYTLKIGDVLTEDDPITLGLKEMAKNVKERTNGHVLIEVYPSSQLGSTSDMIEQALSGANIGVTADTGRLADYCPDMAIYTGPYVFTSVENARKFIDTDIFKSWDAQLEDANLVDLSCNWYQGARNFWTNTPVYTPADLKGLRIRTMGSTVAQETMKALGATPAALSFSEVYSGLQQKVIDGFEAQTTAVYGQSLNEVSKYSSDTEHFFLYTALIINKDWFYSLPSEYQTILKEESVKGGEYATQLVKEVENKYNKEMADKGVTFIHVDKAPFIEASKAVYEKMGWTTLKQNIDQELGQ